MDGIESFYGPAMKDFLDGDTLILTRYLRAKEFHMYGSSRLGILDQRDTLRKVRLYYDASFIDQQDQSGLSAEIEDYNQYAADSF